MKITRPALILDKSICVRNIKAMIAKAKVSGVLFRPHFKTHQSIEIGQWFKELGIDSITVSSVDMAMYFASAGWRNITIAFPFNILEINSIIYLTESITLNILLENTETVDFLAKNLKNEVGVFIKIDAGYQRTGIAAQNTTKIDEVLIEVNKSNKLLFKGFIIHSGHTYYTKNVSEIIDIHNEVLSITQILKNLYKNQFPDLIVSIGDTPSCSVVDRFDDVDEIRPGNFVFYDLIQLRLGSCSLNEIAVVVACPVVSKHEERKEVVIYGGAVHLSKDFVLGKNDEKIFGVLVKLTDGGWEYIGQENYVSNISQEHGILSVTKSYFESIKVGDLVGIIPVHSCLTANLMREIYCFDGSMDKTSIITMMNK